MSNEPKKLKYCVGGQWLESKTDQYMDCYNPSTGEIIAKAPCCTAGEVESAIAAANEFRPREVVRVVRHEVFPIVWMRSEAPSWSHQPKSLALFRGIGGVRLRLRLRQR